jgi:hypothetical protein
VLASITPRGRDVLAKATEAIVQAQFGLGSLDEADCARLTELLTPVRADAGDF